MNAHPSGWHLEIVKLIDNCRIGFLATHGVNGPESSMTPFALHLGGILLHISQLARHSKNINAHPVAGFMICTPETAMDSPLALPRLSLQGSISPVSDAFLGPARQAYLMRIREAEPIFDFTDFRLYMLRPESILWVGGFGSARQLTLASWQDIADKQAQPSART